jgi:hypothetical protein
MEAEVCRWVSPKYASFNGLVGAFAVVWLTAASDAEMGNWDSLLSVLQEVDSRNGVNSIMTCQGEVSFFIVAGLAGT